MSSGQSRENENGVPVGHPVAAKQLIGVLRKGNIAVVGSLAPMDMDHILLPSISETCRARASEILKPQA